MVAFVGKQDPHRHDGTPGLILTAAARFPLPVTDALLLFAEGASDRADGCDEASSAGTQELRAQEVQAGLDALWPGVRVTLADLRVDPSDARAVLRAVRAHPAAQAARADSDGVQTHLLVAGGTPAMREVLSALHITGFLGDTRGWYAPDRGGTLREEVPLVAEAALLASLRTAMQVGEFRAAGLLLPELGHPQSEVAGALLDILALEQQGDTHGALIRLQRWSAPSQLSEWRREAVHALVLHSKPGGGLMHLWNATQVRSPRASLLAYATLLEEALRALCEVRGVRLARDASTESMVNALLQAGEEVPDALNATGGTPRRLYKLRNDAMHHAATVEPTELPIIQAAATELLCAFPAPAGTQAFLTHPHHNPFAPQRHAELARAVSDWLNS